MVWVYLDGHSYNYEVYGLVRAFFNEDVEFIESEEEHPYKGILIKNNLIENGSDLCSATSVLVDGDIVSKYKVNSIKSIDLKINSIEKKIKTGIKQSLYGALSKIVKMKAPWGILTGVRPVKIVNELMDDGFDNTTIYDILINEYKLYSEKAKLIIDIANTQRSFIYPMDKDKFSLYVSVPFCPTRCIYCSFPSNPIELVRNLVDDYTDSVVYELNNIKKVLQNKKIHTVYIGGGTPTSIPTRNLEKIIKTIYELFGRENISEITVEAGRPDTINVDMLKMLKDNQIDRISINPQTMNEKTLKTIGRFHTKKDIIDSFKLARNMGFDLINMDLIVGLPGEGTDEIRYTLEEISNLEPENLTVHTLAIKRGSKFVDHVSEYSLGDQDTINNCLKLCKTYAEHLKLSPYYLYRQKQMLGNFENVGYAIKGKECVYNILIMEEKETIIAVGAGGVSKIFYPSENRIERVPNVKGLHDYLNRTAEMVERKKYYIDSI
ncbi:coproporphyrinogen dehydrogenase HemZ [Anaerosalibacter sp. Marseille-P3206]|uniref:coproporphyrinogen dehydrogenase HemZ n=1 Tax=Anaerosalibacter sp. Marseille-P3206 TaxID=1871005 RepID=UPI000985A9A9|nr:coproporphyrinogen dehydrogenase HemZ [Anaerosalibacter sp. Marseille-P3206]